MRLRTYPNKKFQSILKSVCVIDSLVFYTIPKQRQTLAFLSVVSH